MFSKRIQTSYSDVQSITSENNKSRMREKKKKDEREKNKQSWHHYRHLASNGRRGARINTVEHPMPVLTSPRLRLCLNLSKNLSECQKPEKKYERLPNAYEITRRRVHALAMATARKEQSITQTSVKVLLDPMSLNLQQGKLYTSILLQWLIAFCKVGKYPSWATQAEKTFDVLESQ